MIAALNSFLNGFSLVSLGDAVAEQTTADSGANRDTGGRSIAPGDRTLAPQRESVLGTRPSGQTYSGQPFDDSPSRTPALGDIFPYRGGGAGSSPYIGGNPADTVGAGSDAPTPLYGDADPFRILADVFARGGFGATPEQQPLTQYVPLTGGGGGSSAGVWIVLLLAVAGGAYYFFVYKKGGA